MSQEPPCSRRTERALQHAACLSPVATSELLRVFCRFRGKFDYPELQRAVQLLSTPPFEKASSGVPHV